MAPIPIIITIAAMTGKISPFPTEGDVPTEVKTEEIGLVLFEKFEVKEIMAVVEFTIAVLVPEPLG